MAEKTNIVILGVDYFGTMASAQRVRNLFDPLLDIPMLKVSNIIINESDKEIVTSKVSRLSLRFNYNNIFIVLYSICKGARFIIKHYKKNALNVIYHYDYPSVEYFFFIKIAKLLGYKIVYDIVENIEHYDESKSSFTLKIKHFTSSKLLSQLNNKGSFCFAISKGLTDFLKLISAHVIYLPISVNVEYVSNFKNWGKIVSDQTKVQVFYGGSFGFKDGFEYILKGFELACKSNDSIELILTGKEGKQMKGKVQSLIDSSKFKDRISFLGLLSTQEYFETMANADILCICRINSEYANYGFPFKLGEYLASGNSIITTNIGDVPLYLTHKKNALIIQPESESQICNSILILAQDKQLRARLGISAYKTALKYFSSNTISKIFLENIQNPDNYNS